MLPRNGVFGISESAEELMTKKTGVMASKRGYFILALSLGYNISV